MNTQVLSAILCGIMGVTTLSTVGATFDPAVQLSNIQGQVMVKIPGSGTYVEAEEGRAYPYGTIFQTAEGATAKVSLGDGTSASLSAETTVKFSSDSDSNRHIVMSIIAGRADIVVAENFETSDGKLEVRWRGGYVLAVKAGEYTVETATESELRVLAITVKSGQGTLAGPDYTIETLPAGCGVSIAVNPSLTFLRLRCFAGEFGLTVLDETLTARVVEMTEGRVTKILRKKSATADSIIVTLMEIDKDNNIVRADTYTYDSIDEAKRVLDEETFDLVVGVDEEEKPGDDEEKPVDDEEKPVDDEEAPDAEEGEPEEIVVLLSDTNPGTVRKPEEKNKPVPTKTGQL
ncbi:MAG: FecR domain-containing protein [Kiritimatiellae bacterium]|nr:FecR domain-containing protein [Kiritimatiellia bacterium]